MRGATRTAGLGRTQGIFLLTRLLRGATNSSKLIVTFAGKGVPTDIDGLKAALEAAKPAHIQIEYVFKFNTWADLKSFTWAQLKTGTWADAKVR